MEEIVHRPHAKALINSLRAIGYSFDTALADIIDNSIAAGSHHIRITMRPIALPYVAILDDGCGMDREVLIEAMRHGGIGPSALREQKDLGRYGLGLKTASLSQCRRLTVISKKAEELSAARWDLDEIEQRNDWILTVIPADTLNDLPSVDELKTQANGTLVIWEKCDRAVAGESLPTRAIERLLDGSRDYLSLVFHRYLNPDDGEEPLRIGINGLELEAIDPFMTSNKKTQRLPPELIDVDGYPVSIQPFILPHLGNIKEDELRKAGGRDNLRPGQGFYIYRNRRLISWGTWFRLVNQDELNKLARVRVDIPNALDHLWDLDVKKSRATPPEEVRDALRRIVDRIAEQSQNVFKERRRRARNGVVTHLWDRAAVREGICYLVNREHPFVKEILEPLDHEQRRGLERLFKMLEVGLPAAAIYADMADDRSVELPHEKVVEELRAQLNSRLEAVSNDAMARGILLEALPKLDPFSMYAEITRKLIEDVKSAKQ